jgi:phenylacetate-CoA ligase
MDVTAIAAFLRQRARLRTHEGWTRDELRAYQVRRLADLRTHAVVNSPFYRDLHRGLEGAPLAALPVVTKAILMDRFDDLVTDRAVHLVDVERYLATAAATDRFRDRYRVAETAGTTGRRGIFMADADEWTQVLVSYARAYDWAGVAAGLTHRIRLAVITSTDPTHQSAIAGATVASRFVPTLRLDASQPIDEVVAALNEFRPDSIVGYASVVRILAEEQAAGRLHVTPRAVMSASEVLTADTRERIKVAFGIPVTDIYGATETGGIASECRLGHLHLYEDMVIVEIVDEDDQPVPEGMYGAKTLVTVLFSRTQPLIRYELSDRIAAVPGVPGDLPFSLLAGVEGREEEVLTLGGVTVHPNVFYGALERLPVSGWQVVDEGGSVRVLLAGPPMIDTAVVTDSVRSALDRVGAHDVPVHIDLVDAIPRTALGKAPLIRRAPRSGLGGLVAGGTASA